MAHPLAGLAHCRAERRLTAARRGAMWGAVPGGWATAGPGVIQGWRKVRAPREYGAGQRPAGVKPQGQCHRKQTATAWKHPEARVKGWGKSPPHPRQRGWHGKPHREQGRIGVAGSAARGSPRGADAGAFPPRRPGWPREACGDTGSRGMVVHRFRAGTEPGLQAARHHVFPVMHRLWMNGEGTKKE